MKTVNLKSDVIGITASALCMVHCIVTPFVFITKTCSDVCCASATTWWSWIDISFLIISLFAIHHATKHTSMKWMKFAMWTCWSLLLIVIANEQLELFTLFENAIYIPALSLVALHFYNLKYCSCEKDACSLNQS